MSFGSKSPALPATPAAPTEAEMIAQRVEKSDAEQRAWLRARINAETNVGGKVQAQEEQMGKGLINQKRRALSTEWGLYGARG